MGYRFEDFEVDRARFELRRGGTPVAIQPRALSLLLLLLDARDRLLAKDEIVAALWDGRAISDYAIAAQVKAVRRALGDDGRSQRLIRTVYGVGIGFVGEAEAFVAAEAATDSAEPEVSSEAGRPSIAVLPFRLVGMAGPYGALAEALPDEIITALAKLRWLRVTARGSSFRFPSHDSRAADVGRELDVGYCLSGTMEILGPSLRVGIELADTSNEAVVWREDYALQLDGIHEVRHEIVGQVAAQLDLLVSRQEAARIRLQVPELLDPWQAYHLGIAEAFPIGRPDYDAAERHFDHAVALAPRFARAHAGIAHANYWRLMQRIENPDPDVLARMQLGAETAVELDPFDPFAQLGLGRTRLLQRDVAGCLAAFGQATSLCPSYALAYTATGLVQVILGRVDEAGANIDQALRLSPLDPWRVHMYTARMMIFHATGDIETAVAWGRKALAEAPAEGKIVYASVLAVMHAAGETGEARRIAAEIGRRFPDVGGEAIVRAHPVTTPQIRELIREGFRAHALG